MRTILLSFLLCAVGQTLVPAQPPPEAIIAYVFVKDRVLQPDEIDAAKLTRINYAFANIQDGQMVEGFAHDRENFQVLNGLKRENPQLQVLVSVGGWTWSGGFSDVALTPESRRKFIESAVFFIRSHSLDGLDIDWEYPGLIGIGNKFRPEDKQHYTALVKELRERFDLEEKSLGRRLLLSVATGALPDFVEHTEMGKVARYVDSVNLMAYDYYEPTDSKITGHHAPLFTNPLDPSAVSGDASIKNYLEAGVPTRKIVLGVPFYGHAWAGVAAANHGLFQPGQEAHLQTDYKNIVTLLQDPAYTRYWDATALVPYIYNAATQTFITYEDPESLKLKCDYVLKHHLGGIMFWEYHGDTNEALLNAINTALQRPLPAR